ncbi:MAG: hypothetical protein HOP15_12595 [Planctomycetes bacterium]|nr:hypothetical protein [Planctomycetota bacterium]
MFVPKQGPALRVLVSTLLAGCALGEPQASTPGVLAREVEGAFPVREVTVFKDGHAFVLRETTRAADAAGNVVLDDLPEPVLGTFWPYASGGAKLVSATARRESVNQERTALDLVQLLRANVGRELTLIDVDGGRIQGKLLGLTRRSGEEVEASEPGSGRPRPEEFGSIVRIATASGTRVLPVARVRELETEGELGERFGEEALHERLSLRVDRPASRVTVGVAYVQKGLRWIPAYRLDLDGDGQAAVRLEATLVNDLIDLEGATVHLVVGAPRFEFAGELDPMALREVAAGIGSRAQPFDRFSNLAGNSNMLTTQVAGYVEGAPAPSAPALAGEAAGEDLYLYTVRDVTLRKGERLVLPLSEFTLPYRDVFVLDVPIGPPPELFESFSGERALELARLLAAPKAVHTLRLDNTSQAPLTTAPALVLEGGKLLAQGRMLYTPPGGRTDVAINPAVDVRVELEERESGRTSERILDTDYLRIGLAGSIRLSNQKREPIELEVRRSVLGLVDEVGQGGEKQQRGLMEAWGGSAMPAWWGWYSWPGWWFRFNGSGRFTWDVTLEPGASVALESSWHYFWR